MAARAAAHWAEDLLAVEQLERQALLDPRTVRSAWDDHLAGRRNAEHQLWTVLMLQSWLGGAAAALSRRGA